MIPLFDINVGLNFIDFICDACKMAADSKHPDLHNACPGKTRCDCQHMIPKSWLRGK